MTTLFGIDVEIVIGLGIPATGAAFFIARHFWEKTKCFHLLVQRVTAQENETKDGKKTHVEIFQRLNDIDKNQATQEADMRNIKENQDKQDKKLDDILNRLK